MLRPEVAVRVVGRLRDGVANGWTTGAMARNERGAEVPSTNLDVTERCLVGWVYEVLKLEEPAVQVGLTYDLTRFLEEELGLRPEGVLEMALSAWNDHSGRTQEEIVGCLDRIIERQRALARP